MIYLSAEVVSGLGEDTFWTWFHREFPDSVFSKPTVVNNKDVILQYSTLSETGFPNNTVGLLWELYPEMKYQLKSNAWDKTIAKVMRCAKSSKYKTVPSHLMVDFYKDCGTIDIIPIGVDTDLFKPMDKNALRDKYQIPKNKRVGIWTGTRHPMKGLSNLQKWSNSHPDVYWIIVWKQKSEAGNIPGFPNYIHVNQNTLAELMNCADFFFSCGLLRPFFMVEWEAMACDLPMVIYDDIEKDFIPSKNPRDDIFRLQWDRNTTKKIWEKYINYIKGDIK